MQKMTRRLKRKYDDFHHVAPVSLTIRRVGLIGCALVAQGMPLMRPTICGSLSASVLGLLAATGWSCKPALTSMCCQLCCRQQQGSSCVFALGRCPVGCSASWALVLQSVEEMAPLDQQLEKEHQEKTKVKNIEVRVTAAKHWVAKQCCNAIAAWEAMRAPAPAAF